MFDKILIANRGEIACRVLRTARRLGIATVAVYSESDRGALHVRSADEALGIGGAAAADSYLRADRIIEAALASGARAVHPGYGFLAENAGFAEHCAAAGLVFIGPPPAAMRTMGSKNAAKACMQAAGVPVIPGYHGAAQSLEDLRAAAALLGYPLLVKASAGGGGRGMRAVHHAGELDAALHSARREAHGAFGDEGLLLERLIATPRHIEVQVFCDAHGNAVHLFERDCSLQRRYQKVIEEAPGAGLDAALRERLYAAALAAVAAVDYRGAGTVEMILAGDGSFYFMEMNTRLQVEHTVTEMVTGLDLVEWQLRVAAGEPLPLAQADIRRHGHAVQARLYAEDPAVGFLPASGRLETLRFPAAAGLRIDTGVEAGDHIGIDHDPMIAKLVAWGPDRDSALAGLRTALAATRIAGLRTNAGFLLRALAHPAFIAGGIDTGFIAEHGAALAAPPVVSETHRHLAGLAWLAARDRQALHSARCSAEPDSPWHAVDGWRMNADGSETLLLDDGGGPVPLGVRHSRAGRVLETDGGALACSAWLDDDDLLQASIGEHHLRMPVALDAAGVTLLTAQGAVHLRVIDALPGAADEAGSDASLRAPMPGRVLSVAVASGAPVTRGQTLMVLEAMKMEHAIVAPRDGRIAEVYFGTGNLVDEGAELLTLADPD